MRKFSRKVANRKGGIRKRRIMRKVRARTTGTKLGVSLGFPYKAKFKHRYVENLSMSSVGGVLAVHKYKANGMYDPNYGGSGSTSVGHQPLYFDNLSTLYNHYTVIGSRIKVTFVDADSTANLTPVYLGIIVDDDMTALTNAISMMENRQCKKLATISDMRQGRYVLKENFSLRKQFGGGSVLQNSQYYGTASTDPSEITAYHIFMQPMDGSADITIRMLIEIDYIAVWTESIPQAFN